MMRLGISALLVCGVLILPVPAAAAVPTPAPGSLRMLLECNDSRLYDAASTDAPAPVAAALKAEGKRLVFRTCRDLENNTHYFMREPHPNPAGVCRTVEREIFPGAAEDAVLVQVLYDGTAPNWYFTMAGCPPTPGTLGTIAAAKLCWVL